MRWLAIVLLLSASPATGAEPFARASIDGGDGIVPGQQVHVIVDVFAPDFFTSPPQFPLFDLPDALVTLPDDRAQNMVQTVGGQQYSGIRRSYAIVPERSGAFTIPPIRIPLGWSVDGKPTEGEVTTSSVAFEVGDGTDVFFAAKGLQITQSFDRDPASLKVGEALVRTIVATASETQGLTIPAVDVGVVHGLREYVKPAKIEDGVQLGRGETASRRTETIVYTADKAGGFTIPAVSYPWFDVDARSDEAANLPAVAVNVAVSAPVNGIAIKEDRQQPEPSTRRRQVTFAILLLLAVVTAAWLGRQPPAIVVLRLQAFSETMRSSRTNRVRRLRQIIRSAPGLTVYAALQSWSREAGFRTLRDWANDAGQDARAELDRLEASLFGRSIEQFDRRVLARLVGARPTTRSALKASALPPLNP